jgi:hypothetical protein
MEHANLKVNRALVMYCRSTKLRSTFTIGLLETSSCVVSMRQFQTQWTWKKETKCVIYAECCCYLKTRKIPARCTASSGTLECFCIYQQTYKTKQCLKVIYFSLTERGRFSVLLRPVCLSSFM